MSRINENILYPILGVGLGAVGSFLLYYLVKSCCKSNHDDDNDETRRLLGSYNKKVKKIEEPERYIIFLDIDGSTTILPGGHPQSLFSLYFTNQLDWVGKRDNIIKTLFKSREKFEIVRSFLQTLTNQKNVEIVITTNNFKDAIKQLWAYCFKSSWDLISSRSAFRESGQNNKVFLINNYLTNDLTLQESRDLTSGKLKAIYFEDDLGHLQNACVNGHKDLCIVDCSKGEWLGKRLLQCNMKEINEETCINFLKSC